MRIKLWIGWTAYKWCCEQKTGGPKGGVVGAIVGSIIGAEIDEEY